MTTTERSANCRGTTGNRPTSIVGLVAAAASTAGVVAHRTRYTWPYRPVLERIELENSSGRPDFAPLRIGFITDTHVGPMIRARDVERALETLFASRPDILLLGGDYVCESPRFISEAASVIGDYAAFAPHGALAILGNHDYSNDARRLTAQFERRGIQVLVNDAARISTASGDVWIVGIDDAMLSTPDLERAFRAVTRDAPAIALWHEPDLAHQAARFGPLIQLSGHSHGGQIRLPMIGHIAAPSGGRRYVAGMHSVDGMRVYTSRGVGVYRPPVRFRCPPEVTLFTLG